MVAATTKLKERIMFWKELWPTKFFIYRNRGNTFAPDVVPAVRLKYDDRPNTHKLRTGERLPAVPLNYVMTGDDGTPWVHAVEADDDQMVVFKPDFSLEDEVPSPVNSNKLDVDTDLEAEELQTAFEDEGYDVVNFSVLDNRDERLTFLAEEIKTSETKYKPSSLIREYPQLTLTIGAAVAFAIIIYATSQEYGQFIPVLKQLSGNMDVISQLAKTSAPPGG